MKKLLSLTLILLSTLMFFIFHDTGNRLIKPYLGDYLAIYLKPKLKQDMGIKIEDLKIE